MRRISSHYLLTPQGLMPRRIVTVDKDGVVTGITADENLDSKAGVEFYPGIIIPGLVNSHCHFELSYLRGAIPRGGGFTGFARGMRACRGKFTMRERVDAAGFWEAKMWADGIAAVGDICNDASVFGIKARSRIRWHNFSELFGLDADPRRAENLSAEALDRCLTSTVTPHSTYSLNRDGFAAAVGDQDNRPLSIHFMESDDESELFEGRGRMWEWYANAGFKVDFLSWGSPAERLIAQVPADRPIMLIHNCRTTQRDIDIVMEHFTAPVTWVLCPGSNDYISGLTPPVELLRKNGLRIAVGTDSLASNTTLSMVRELGFFQGVPLREILVWATLNGAKALGMDDVLGSIEVGKAPGLVLLSGVDLNTMTLTPDSHTQRII